MATLHRLWEEAIACGARPGEGQTQIVPGEGDVHAALALVGEAPGEQEDRLGRPFVGRAGRLLDRLLVGAQLSRDRVWITNVVKLRPVAIEDGHFRNRAPTAAEIRLWLPCLTRELAIVAPRVIVAMGAVAGRVLVSDDFALTRSRGRWSRDRLIGAEVIATWHPAYLLRRTGADHAQRMAETLADLRAAASRLG